MTTAAEKITADELIRFLSDRESYPHRPEGVRIVQTHISIVALAGDRVFKVKKPVDFGFLDFTTLKKRRHYCHEEVRLNRRMCAEIYEGVTPILVTTDRSGVRRLRFGSEDDTPGAPDPESDAAIEFAVRMKRLDDRYFMDRLLAEDRITAEDLRRVAEKLAGFYNAHPATPATSAWGRVDRIRISVDENFEQIRPQEGKLISRAAARALEAQADRFFRENERLLEHRRTTGMVRDCHGDLHLDHVHIDANRVCIYDCIEFNERFRCIDVASDIGFLAMDLDFNERPDLSLQFERLMTEALGDQGLPALLPFYKTYRAVVRGKVAGFRVIESETAGGQQGADEQQSADEARRYYRLALRYAVTNDRPFVIAVMGMVGTGKSTQARLLGEALGWRVVSSDETRKKLAGQPLFDRTHVDERRALYSEAMSRATYESVLEAAREELDGNRGVILDATFSRREDRDLLREFLRGAPCWFVEIHAPDYVLRDRLRERETADGIISDARLEDFEMLSSRYQAPATDEQNDTIRITSAATMEATHRLLLEGLVARAPSAPQESYLAARPANFKNPE